MKRLLIAGGGTGGHIYPAIAIAQVLKKQNPELEIHFVGTIKGLESKIVPKEGYPLHFIKVGALNQVGLSTKILTLLLLPVALIQSLILVLKLNPGVVLGVGGYASGPAMLAAKILGKPTVLFEPNAQPGLTNRWLAPLVKKAFLNFEASSKYFRDSEIVGIPVREGLGPEHRTAPTGNPLNILIFGGSQGARGINTTVVEAVRRGGDWLNHVNIVHQVGNTDFSKVKLEYEKIAPKTVKWFEFLYDMPDRYKKADLVICRAGASTLAELAACEKASILVPFPAASDNHQQKNAEALSVKKAAVMVLQGDFTPEKFIELVTEFTDHPEKLISFEKEVAHFFKPRSAERIAEAIRMNL